MKKLDFKSANGRTGEKLRLTLLAIAVIVITILVNAIASLFPMKIDMTSEQLYSLSEQSEKILESINEDVSIIGLFDRYSLPSDDKYIEIINLLEEYEKHNHISVRYEDPDNNPGIISELDPSGLYDLKQGSFVVKCGSKTKVLSSSDFFAMNVDYSTLTVSMNDSTAEQAFSGAINYVANAEGKKVYLLTGHGEENLAEFAGTVVDYLDSQGFVFEQINLITESARINSGDTLLCVSPKTDLSDDELKILDVALHEGMNAILLFSAQDSKVTYANWNKFLSEINIELQNDVVIETNPAMYAANDPKSFIAQVSDAKKEFAGGVGTIVLMQNARSMKLLDNKKDYLNVRPLVLTSESAADINYADESTHMGSESIGALAETSVSVTPSRIAVLGSSEFMSDATLEKYATSISTYNVRLILDVISWVRMDEDYVVVPAKSYSDGKLLITGEQAKIASIIIIGIIPGIILALGIWMFVRRRHL